LFVQVQDATFGLEFMPVPKYLREDPAYHGGVAQQASYPDGKPEKAKPYGWVARRWDPAVRERFHKLLAALGKECDGEIEGVNLPESAIDIPYAGPLMPSGYTREGYRDALLETMAALKKAFPRSTALLYANFMAEADPSGKPLYLRSLYEKAAELKLAMGGPDLLPHRKWQLLNSYPLIREFSTTWTTLPRTGGCSWPRTGCAPASSAGSRRRPSWPGPDCRHSSRSRRTRSPTRRRWTRCTARRSPA
jgi:hypothetical protein